MNAKPLLPLLLSLLLGVPALAQDAAEVPAFAAPDFDDSSWQTTILPPADAARLWPDGFTGVIWYRCTFELENDLSSFWYLAALVLGRLNTPNQVFLNGTLVGSDAGSNEIWSRQVSADLFHRGTNVLAMEVTIVNGGEGFQCVDRFPMALHLADIEFYDGPKEGGSVVNKHRPIPLSGPWKFLLLPSL